MEQYIALLRRINVGGHHKVPMSDLKKLLKKMGYHNIQTLLNSGNVVFEAKNSSIKTLEENIAVSLEKKFGFPIPTIVREAKSLKAMCVANPFQNIEMNKNIRLYVTFLQEVQEEKLTIPWISDDDSFRIIKTTPSEIYGVLDVSIGKSTDAMNILAKTYGKNITTRNWNTLVKIEKLLS